MVKFIVKENTVTFTALVTKQQQDSTPCLTVAAVGIPKSGPAFKNGKLQQGEHDASVPFIKGCQVWTVTVIWDESLQTFKLHYIQTRKNEENRNPFWKNNLQLIGWVSDQANQRLWNALSMRLRSNPRITEHVSQCANERRDTLRLQLGAVRYHKANGKTTEEALELVLGKYPEQHNAYQKTTRSKVRGFKKGNKGRQPNDRTYKPKHHKQKQERSINRAFANLNV